MATKTKNKAEAIHRAVWIIAAILVLLAFCGQAWAANVVSTKKAPIQHQGADTLAFFGFAIHNLPSPAVGFIDGLFFAGGPSAVSRLVIPVIIDAVESEATRPPAHVGDEIREILAPALTNSDSATAISRIFSYLWPVAAIQHGVPHKIFRPDFMVACRSVSKIELRFKFDMETAATTRVTSAQARPTNRRLVAAFAAAIPDDLFASKRPRCAVQNSQHYEASECLS